MVDKKIKKLTKKKKPKFTVMNLGFMKSVPDRWRRPRGTANKKRRHYAFAGAYPKIGYKNPEQIRGLHPLGKKEMLVNNVYDLNKVKDKDMLVRIAGKVGAKKRNQILEKAKLMSLVVLNPQTGKMATQKGTQKTTQGTIQKATNESDKQKDSSKK